MSRSVGDAHWESRSGAAPNIGICKGFGHKQTHANACFPHHTHHYPEDSGRDSMILSSPTSTSLSDQYRPPYAGQYGRIRSAGFRLKAAGLGACPSYGKRGTRTKTFELEAE